MKISPTGPWVPRKDGFFLLFITVFNSRIFCLKSFTRSSSAWRLTAKIMFATEVILYKTPKRKMLEPEVLPKSKSLEPWAGSLCYSLFNNPVPRIV